MHVLIIKLSSLGDLIHTLPAITDALVNQKVTFDWVVESSFAEIPQWHNIRRVIPVQLRNWRTKKWAIIKQIYQVYKQLRMQKYDVVIDLQGLLKSALLSRCARATKYVGFAKNCVREPLASYLYTHTVIVSEHIHIITKLRLAIAEALGYSMPKTAPMYGLKFVPSKDEAQYIMLLHGTTWANKHWPEEHWAELIKIIVAHGFVAKMTWGNEAQKARVTRLKSQIPQLVMLPHLTINQAADTINNAVGVVSVDTGFGHLAVALGKPIVMLFGPSNSKVVGPEHDSLKSTLACVPCNKRMCYIDRAGLQPPCLADITPSQVWEQLQQRLKFMHIS